MSANSEQLRPEILFQRSRVGTHDERVFMLKLFVATALTAGGVFLALQNHWLPAFVGIFLLGMMYTHAAELQHQCLHHSSFRKTVLHRAIGIPLGIPMLISYSHYRVRHLQHHRYLGTDQDTEFFGFDTRQRPTWKMLFRGLFDYGRLATVIHHIVHSYRGTWQYGLGQIGVRRRREIIVEYRLFGLLIVGVAVLTFSGFGETILRLWLLPLLFAIPMHFLVEVPEHLLCDTETTNILHNTRSIRGSWFSTWFTNGNNLHIEHHSAMMTPINQLPVRHSEVRAHATHVERHYFAFYLRLLRAVARS